MVVGGEAAKLAKNREDKAMQEATAEAMMRFAEFDTDGDMKLDWDEFLALQTKAIRQKYSEDEIRSWFDVADADGNGSLSISEWFVWTMDHMSEKFGEDCIQRMFRK